MDLNLRNKLKDSGEIDLSSARPSEELSEPDKIENMVSRRRRIYS